MPLMEGTTSIGNHSPDYQNDKLLCKKLTLWKVSSFVNYPKK